MRFGVRCCSRVHDGLQKQVVSFGAIAQFEIEIFSFGVQFAFGKGFRQTRRQRLYLQRFGIGRESEQHVRQAEVTGQFTRGSVLEFEPGPRAAAPRLQKFAGVRNGTRQAGDVKIVGAEIKFARPCLPAAVTEKRSSEPRADVDAVFMPPCEFALNARSIVAHVLFKRKVDVFDRGRAGARLGNQILKAKLAGRNVNAALAQEPVCDGRTALRVASGRIVEIDDKARNVKDAVINASNGDFGVGNFKLSEKGLSEDGAPVKTRLNLRQMQDVGIT